ncbi:hypothetical protein BDZ91DRAFT_748568 [Kalaharituber pfeilii]|nr:hypothetical protein BDZ91DRAFT_748568 [Kalaharituber pfeilii]
MAMKTRILRVKHKRGIAMVKNGRQYPFSIYCCRGWKVVVVLLGTSLLPLDCVSSNTPLVLGKNVGCPGDTFRPRLCIYQPYSQSDRRCGLLLATPKGRNTVVGCPAMPVFTGPGDDGLWRFSDADAVECRAQA